MTRGVVPCPYCGAETVRVTVGGTLRSLDAAWNPSGPWVLDEDAGRALPCKTEGASYDSRRRRLHKDSCPSWAGPVGG